MFMSCKEKETDGLVQLDEICAYISEDDMFFELLTKPVRKPYEGNPEILENLLARMLTDHRGAQISWFQLLSYFSKRGKPSPEMNQLHASCIDFAATQRSLATVEVSDDQKLIQKRDNLTKNLHQTLGYKSELVPKTGKGNYNITVPKPPSFMKRDAKKEGVKTIRE